MDRINPNSCESVGYLDQENAKSISKTQNPHHGDDDDEEYSTEIIPRSLPTPMEKIKTLSSNSNEKRSEQKITKYDQKESSPFKKISMVQQENGNLHRPSSETRKASNELGNELDNELGNEEIVYNHGTENQHYTTPIVVPMLEQKTPSCTKHSMSSIKTKLFKNPTQLSSTDLVERTSAMLGRLSSLDFIPKERTTTIRDHEICGGKESHEHFLLLLYKMIESVCHEESNNTANDSNNNDGVTLQLHSLLSIMENVIDKLFKANQEVANWKEKYNEQIHFNDNNESKQSTSTMYSSLCSFDDNYRTVNHACENNIQSSQAITLLQQENETLRRQLMEIDESPLMELQTQLTVKHLDCERFQEMLHSLEQERNHLHHVCQTNESTNANLEREICTLHTEYKDVANENSKLQTEVMKQSQCINDYERRLKLSEDNVNALDVARNEILTKWNSILKERTRLEGELGQCLRENSILRQQLQYTQEEKSRLSQRIETLENDAQKRIAELTTCNREKKKIVIELDIIKQTLSNIQEENHRLGQDLNSKMMCSDLTSQKIFELEQLAAKSQYNAEAFRNMVSEVEMEKEAIKTSLEEARIKIQKLENVKSSIEARESTASEQVRKLIREKALLTSKLNEANARSTRSLLNENNQSAFILTTRKIPSKVLKTHEEKVVISSETYRFVAADSQCSETMTNLQLSSSMNNHVKCRDKPQNCESIVGTDKQHDNLMNPHPNDTRKDKELLNIRKGDGMEISSMQVQEEQDSIEPKMSVSLLDYLPQDTVSTID